MSPEQPPPHLCQHPPLGRDVHWGPHAGDRTGGPSLWRPAGPRSPAAAPHGHGSLAVGLAPLHAGGASHPAPELSLVGNHPGGSQPLGPLSTPPRCWALPSRPGCPARKKTISNKSFISSFRPSQFLSLWPAGRLPQQLKGHCRGARPRGTLGGAAPRPPPPAPAAPSDAAGLCAAPRTRWGTVAGGGSGGGAGGHRAVSSPTPTLYLAPRSRRKRRAAFLFPEPPAPGGSEAAARSRRGSSASQAAAAPTCDHLLRVVGLHVAVVLPQALGFPLPLGALGVVGVSVVLQDDDLGRGRASLAASWGLLVEAPGVPMVGSGRGRWVRQRPEPGRARGPRGPRGRTARPCSARPRVHQWWRDGWGSGVGGLGDPFG